MQKSKPSPHKCFFQPAHSTLWWYDFLFLFRYCQYCRCSLVIFS